VLTRGRKMSKIITAVRIKKERAEDLKEKSIELTVKRKEIIRESDLVNFLIDEYLETIDIDNFGLKTKED